MATASSHRIPHAPPISVVVSINFQCLSNRSKERPTLGTMQRNLTMLPRGAVKGVLVRLI